MATKVQKVEGFPKSTRRAVNLPESDKVLAEIADGSVVIVSGDNMDKVLREVRASATPPAGQRVKTKSVDTADKSKGYFVGFAPKTSK